MGAMAEYAISDRRIGNRICPADLAAAIQGSEAAVQGLYLVLADYVWQETHRKSTIRCDHLPTGFAMCSSHRVAVQLVNAQGHGLVQKPYICYRCAP